MRVLFSTGGDKDWTQRVRDLAARAAYLQAREPLALVVTAPEVSREELALAVWRAGAGDRSWQNLCTRVISRLEQTARDVAASDDELTSLLVDVEEQTADLRDLLHAAFVLRDGGPRFVEAVLAQGELAAAVLTAAALRAAGVPAVAVDPRPLISVPAGARATSRADLDASLPRLAALLPASGEVAVLAGGVATSALGETVRLAPGGGEQTAALAAAALGAARLELWLEVLPTLSGPHGEAVPALSWGELEELAAIHPTQWVPAGALIAAREAGLELELRSWADPLSPGITITSTLPPAAGGVRALLAPEPAALLRVEGEAFAADPGPCPRVLGALFAGGVTPQLAVRSWGEPGLTVGVNAADAPRALELLREELSGELAARLVRAPEVVLTGEAQVAVTDDPAARSALVVAWQQAGAMVVPGARSVTWVTPSGGRPPRLEPTVGGPGRPRLELVVAGAGRVGAALLDQLAQAATNGLDVRLLALWTRRAAAVVPRPVPLAGWREALAKAPRGVSAKALLAHLAELGPAAPGVVRVLVDNTASEDLPAAYGPFVAAGFHLVAANKRFFAGPWADYRQVLAAAAAAGRLVRHEATVGAGLPVLSTLAELRATGDQVLSIEGVLSGTLAAVLDHLAQGETYSRAVRRAADDGFTEPHPADDLCGLDVARKLVILARAAGLTLHLEDVEVDPLLPPGIDPTTPLAEFWAGLPALDAELAERQAEAAASGQRLRYLARLELGARPSARVALGAVSADHPAHGLAGPDNLIAFTTRRYHPRPLTIRGPGAGSEVTAAGVFADLLAILRSCGAEAPPP